MASPVTIGRASVLISPSFRDMQKQTRKATEASAGQLRTTFERAGQDAGRTAGRNLSRGVETSTKATVRTSAKAITGGLATAGRKGGEGLSKGLETGTKRVSSLGGRLFRALPSEAQTAGRRAGTTLRTGLDKATGANLKFTRMFSGVGESARTAGTTAGRSLKSGITNALGTGRLAGAAMWVDLKRDAAREGLESGRVAARNLGMGLQSAGGRINGIWAKFKEAARRGGREAGDAAGREVSGGVGRHATGAGRGAGRRIMGGIGGAISGGAAAIFAPLAAAAATAGIGTAIFRSIEEASRSEQAKGALEAVLGTASGAVLRDARRAATTSGMSSADYMTQATTLGAQGKNYLGHEGTNLKRYVDEQFALARDMAAMSGGTTQEAIEALAAANRGEFEQIERYNMMMKVDNVTARMKKEGIEDTPEARARMQNQMLNEQADKIGITGQFEREGGSYEQSRNTARAGLQNAFATLGEGFMPAANKLLQWINKNWMPKIQSMAEGLRDFLGPALEGMGPKVLELASMFSPIGAIFEVLKPSLPIIGDAIGQVVQALAPLAAELLPIVAEILGTIGTAVAEVLAAVLPPLLDVLTTVIQAIGPILPAIADALLAIVTPLADLAVMLVEALAPIFPIIGAVIGALLPPLVELMAWMLEARAGWLADIITWLADTLRPHLAELAQDLSEDLPAAFKAAGDFISQKWNELVTFFTDMGEGFKSDWQAICDFFQVTVPGAFQAAKDWILQIWASFTSAMSAFGQSIQGAWQAVVNFFTVTLPAAFQAGAAWIRGVWESFVKFLLTKVDQAVNKFNFLKNVVTVVLPAAFREGVAWIRGKWDEFTGFISRGVDSIRGFLDRLVGLVTRTLPDAFRNGVQGISAQWDKLKRKVGEPVNVVIGTVYNNGIRKIWNTVADKVGLPGLPEVSEIAFADGGVLPGYTPGVDVHRFFSPTGGRLDLSGGEAIMRPEFTRLVGGEAGVAALNAAARAGRLPRQAFAGGGVFDGAKRWLGDTVDAVKDGAMDIFAGPTQWVKDKIGGIVDRLASSVGGGEWGKMGIAMVRKLVDGLAAKASEWVGGMFGGGPIPTGSSGPLGGSWQSLWASIGPVARSLGLMMTSNYRPGARTAGYGSVSRHAMGKAVDIAGPSPAMAAMTRWLDATHGPNLYELIYSPLNGRHMRYRGRHYRETNPTTLRMHYNHIHASVFDEGGMAPAGLGGSFLLPGVAAVANFSGAKEPVFTDGQWSSIHTLAKRGATMYTLPDEVILMDRDGSILARTEVVAANAVDRRSAAVAGW